MQKRNTQQRRRAIIERLNDRHEVAVDELAKLYSTSEVTIRKDLAELENNGLLLRRFGGAVLLPAESSELSSEKLSSRKKAIAGLAATLIQDHNRIIIDSGSTTSALLPHLPKKLGLVVMTNSLQVANVLLEGENEPQVLMTGGTWDAQSHSFQGQMAEQMLTAYNFDQAFLGAAGIDINRGSTTFNELTSLSRTMAEVSKQVIVLAESEKLQRKIPNIELPWSQISILVTDDGIEDDAKRQIEQHGVTVLCATTLESV
ncbi:DeoR/GlpR family DNA-binding transcription regulator [Aliiglaciecola sp. LCG003]|uniref:DeoR/GlpR family DNA-binding transcription regulator n=1 Tax=Aliiglaciecola sp. LCG003 TaxID=3053655 RepID=UPI002572CF9C|nr:DeoR/GlpR family DNA-binding transcription regulator [Aliiglaciecola sp. LCG003]WJG09220.1 DeoR/GlpR family DNA-binding transcription regulator [Aliiglaciecola sp. LCG003]